MRKFYVTTEICCEMYKRRLKLYNQNMKYAKGFVSILIVIIALVIIGGGIYLSKNKKVETSISADIETQANSIEVAGMQQYTDQNFGFSFWYPKSWSIKESIVPDKDLAEIYEGGKIIKSVTVASPEEPNDGIAIEEFISSDKSIKDNSVCGPAEGCASSLRYYFDSNTHTWMLESYFDFGQYSGGNLPSKIIAANVSNNSMGGLHILYGNARFSDNRIIPLSAKNFLVVHNVSAGTGPIEPLAKTILALDPKVATPLSREEQIKMIQMEADAYIK